MSTRTIARWIECVSWFFVALGVTLPFAFPTLPFSLYREALTHWAYGVPEIAAADERLLGLMLGITGGSIAGKWVVHAWIARGPLAEGKAWARDLTLAGLALWFLVDSLASVLLGAAFNVWMINLLPLLLVGIPLLISFGQFHADAEEPRQTTASRVCFWTSVVGATTGIAIAFGAESPLFTLWFQGLEAAHYGGASLAESARRLAVFFFGPIGGCTLAQFVMLAIWVRREGATARVAMAGASSIALWFSVDSIYGLANDGLFNIALINVPAALMTLPAWLVLCSSTRQSES